MRDKAHLFLPVHQTPAGVYWSCEQRRAVEPQSFAMEREDPAAGLSTAAMVAIGCNALVAVLLLLLCLVLYRACRIPSSLERLPVLVQSGEEPQQANKHKYLLTS